MVDVADVFRRFAPGYQAAHGASMPPSHRRAIADILACRTEALGGHLERCTACGAEVHRCHSCRNRSCPKCHGEQTRAWLDKRQAEMLACPYFHVTVTVPEELRAAVWRTPWVVHITPWGVGEQAVLDYLARYVFRIALTDRRIVGLDDETVSFQYRDRKAGPTRTCRVPGHEFLRRYLQHVLPKGFHKVRYFGLWHPSRRSQATRVRHALRLDRPIGPPPSPEPQGAPDPQPSPEPGSGTPSLPPKRPCPRCRTGLLIVIARWSPMRPRAP